jgi:hypothetical protein
VKWVFAILLVTQAHAGAAFHPGQFSPAEPTAEQKAACLPDVFKLCSHAVPDADAVKRCMLFNKRHLSPECRGAFQ